MEIETIKATRDGDDLADKLEEWHAAARADRVQALGPVILARLAELEAPAAYARATATYAAWRKGNPTLSAQLRQLERQRAITDQQRTRAYAKARETFKIGAARYGIRLS